MEYRIGVVSKLLGISAEGLRLYEREGILNSRREEGGGYRLYGHLDITALMRARSYHNSGFSLKETEYLINTSDVKGVLESYRKRQEDLEQEIAVKQKMLEYMKEIHSLSERIAADLWCIRKEKRPEMYRFEFMDGDRLIIGPEKYEEFQTWVNLAPFAFPAQRNDWKAVLNGEDHSISALGIFGKDAEFLGIGEREGIVRHPPCECLYTVVKLEGEEALSYQYLNHLVEYVKNNHIHVVGDPIARTFLSMNKRENYTRYRQIWVPVEESFI
ncbi:MerR family transcriptional regulator [Clostridium sp. MCC353]|uniref:MerR family transcriptional regulator n=1 Tax=Clostridium sp. MCC353 TaxID=2592646 RepID=UPI001C01F4EE|nr:MerR family transcriptional regulator [Clostridium sp. MCC353]